MENQTLEQLVKEEQRIYKKEWRARNPDKVRKHSEDYWRRRAEKRLQEREGGANATNTN